MNTLTAIDQTMTSREIAELTGKRHADVLRDIDRIIKSLDADLRSGFKSTTYADQTGKSNRMFELDRDSTYCLVAGYDPSARMRIIKRWQDLEAKVETPTLPDFNDPVAAARAWADAKESEQQALVKLEEAKPAVEFHQRVGVAEDCHTIDEVAKLFRAGPRKLRQWMRDQKILRLDGLPASGPMDRGYFRVIEKPVNLPFGHKLHRQVLVTGKGLVWLQHRLDHGWLEAV